MGLKGRYAILPLLQDGLALSEIASCAIRHTTPFAALFAYCVESFFGADGAGFGNSPIGYTFCGMYLS